MPVIVVPKKRANWPPQPRDRSPLTSPLSSNKRTPVIRGLIKRRVADERLDEPAVLVDRGITGRANLHDHVLARPTV